MVIWMFQYFTECFVGRVTVATQFFEVWAVLALYGILPFEWRRDWSGR
jgi:hypothetical protein